MTGFCKSGIKIPIINLVIYKIFEMVPGRFASCVIGGLSPVYCIKAFIPYMGMLISKLSFQQGPVIYSKIK